MSGNGNLAVKQVLNQCFFATLDAAFIIGMTQ